MRKVSDESHSVRQNYLALGGQLDVPHCGIESGEHASAFQNASFGQRVEERRLAGVGIADERHGCDRRGFPALALLSANAADILQLLLDMSDAAIDLAAIGFQLGLART